MINFRFHIVSIIAVFLALAIGIVMGSTFIDRVIVDSLNARLERVEKHDEQVDSDNKELKQQVDALQGFVDQSVPLLGGRRLEGSTIVPVAVRGIDGGAVHDTVEVLRSAGANVPAVVWLEPVWAFTERTAGDKLAAAIGIPPVLTTAPANGSSTTRAAGPNSPSTLPPALDTLRKRGLTALATRLGARPGATDNLVSLQAAGFVAIDSQGQGNPDLASFPNRGARVVIIGGDDTSRLSQAIVTPLAQAFLDTGGSVTVGEVYKAANGKNGRTRGDVVADIRRDQALAARVATVDDVDLAQGRAALVLSLQEVSRGVIGHYGVGRGAKRQVPLPAGAP
jgi:hypothetical protein